MRNMSILATTLVFTTFFSSACAAETIRGDISFHPECPGDTEKSGDESFIAALLTPLLTGIVNQGLKTAGEKLSAAAKEANIDIVHRGDHFYEWKSEQFELQYRCLIVWSKGVKETGRSLSSFVSSYEKAETSKAASTSALAYSFSAGSTALENELKDVGMQEDKLPGMLGVFDIELSEQRTEARLVPRFIMMDHSVREKRTDTKSRTMTFEFAFSVPGADKPFGAPSIKLDDLVIGEAFVVATEPKPRLTSPWFSLPALPETVTKARGALKEASSKAAAELTAAILAGTIAVDRGDTVIKDFIGEDVPCDSKEEILKKWLKEETTLSREKDKQAAKQSHDVARYENSTLHYKSCLNYIQQQAVLDKLRSGGVNADQVARSFDVTVTMKEFRKRPFAEFFGAVLSDDTTRTGLTGAIVGELDPATKAAEEKTAQENAVKGREAYETAYIAAETAIGTYVSTPDVDVTKAAKFVDMEAKKRTANRRAQDLGVGLPYPDAGLWIG